MIPSTRLLPASTTTSRLTPANNIDKLLLQHMKRPKAKFKRVRGKKLNQVWTIFPSLHATNQTVNTCDIFDCSTHKLHMVLLQVAVPTNTTLKNNFRVIYKCSFIPKNIHFYKKYMKFPPRSIPVIRRC